MKGGCWVFLKKKKTKHLQYFILYFEQGECQGGFVISQRFPVFLQDLTNEIQELFSLIKRIVVTRSFNVDWNPRLPCVCEG